MADDEKLIRIRLAPFSRQNAEGAGPGSDRSNPWSGGRFAESVRQWSTTHRSIGDFRQAHVRPGNHRADSMALWTAMKLSCKMTTAILAVLARAEAIARCDLTGAEMK